MWDGSEIITIIFNLCDLVCLTLELSSCHVRLRQHLRDLGRSKCFSDNPALNGLENKHLRVFPCEVKYTAI